jgi:hypothetical protein
VLQGQPRGLKAGSAQTQRLLDALESLLTLDADADPFPRVFASLRRVFTFTHALMLTQDAHPRRTVCAARWPSRPRRWASAGR